MGLVSFKPAADIPTAADFYHPFQPGAAAAGVFPVQQADALRRASSSARPATRWTTRREKRLVAPWAENLPAPAPVVEEAAEAPEQQA